jgi:hypothetical protein
MKLTIEGMQHAKRTRFKHLWGRYVLGFKPAHHCLSCFKSRTATAINPRIVDGEYQLDPSYELFYLCGVGWTDRGNTNVHLAVTPRIDSVACVGSVYGVRFTITDAQAIPIRYIEKAWRGLPDEHSQCKNFQFGYQMFAADRVGPEAEGELIAELRNGGPLRAAPPTELR